MLTFNHKRVALWVATAFWAASAAIAQDGQLSTHILDINKGEPARDVSISLFRYDVQSEEWIAVATGRTDTNGRLAGLLSAKDGNNGIYKLRFAVAEYFSQLRQASIYPFIEVVFRIDNEGHYHIPLTLSANGYSTYRGS